MRRKTVLTIAGSDCSGGAGIQADLKTMLANGVYGMSVITALTAQNTVQVAGILETQAEFTGQQMDCVCSDILPDAVKIGMLYSTENIRVVAERLAFYKRKEIVLDPVLFSSNGRALLKQEAARELKQKLFPMARLITPNLFEAGFLCGMEVRTKEDMVEAAKRLAGECGASVLLKGGHMENTADDLLFTEGEFYWFPTARIDNPNTHGTGCTLSSAIACGLAKGKSLKESVGEAKTYVRGAIAAGLSLGTGVGPLDHGWTNYV